MRVLVIEDNADLRDYLRLALGSEGYEVLTARNGKEALSLIDGRALDAVITDLFMPEMDGIETIAAVRRRMPGVRIVAISGRSGVDYLTVAKELGVMHTLRKPFEIDELLKALAT
jgi:DNA-binding response OmpR family regulator